MFQRFLSALRQRVMFFSNRLAAQVVQRQGGVMAAQTDANRVEIAGFGDDRNGAAAPGGGLLIDFFDQPAFNKLTRDFGHAGRGKLALLGNLNT